MIPIDEGYPCDLSPEEEEEVRDKYWFRVAIADALGLTKSDFILQA